MNFGLALSGGGIRGATHVGVIMAMEEAGLYPNAIAGTSAGSIVAGLYSLGYNGKRLKQVVEEIYKNQKWFMDYDIGGMVKCACKLMLRCEPCLKGLIKGDNLERFINELTWGVKVSECGIDTVIPTVDILSGETVVYTNYNVFKKDVCDYIYGDDEVLSKVIRASCSVPAVFVPKKIGDRVLVDGGVTNNLPVDMLIQNGSKNVIAVDITGKFVKPENINIVNVAYSSLNIMSSCLKELTSTGEMINLKPKLPEEATLLNFDAMERCMEIGYEYTRSMIPTIKSIIRN